VDSSAAFVVPREWRWQEGYGTVFSIDCGRSVGTTSWTTTTVPVAGAQHREARHCTTLIHSVATADGTTKSDRVTINGPAKMTRPSDHGAGDGLGDRSSGVIERATPGEDADGERGFLTATRRGTARPGLSLVQECGGGQELRHVPIDWRGGAWETTRWTTTTVRCRAFKHREPAHWADLITVRRAWDGQRQKVIDVTIKPGANDAAFFSVINGPRRNGTR